MPEEKKGKFGWGKHKDVPYGLARVEQHVTALRQWLQEQLPKCALFPSAKLCVEKAIKWLPKYEAGLEAARAAGPSAKGPKLFDDSDSD